jgi:hypothetical protein
MTRPRTQVAVAQAVQQIINTAGLVELAELLVNDRAHVGGSQGADAIILHRSGVQPLAKLLFLFFSEMAVIPAAFVGQTVDATGVVVVNPLLHGATPATQALGDVRRRTLLLGQDNGLQLNPPSNVTLLFGQFLELFQGVMFHDSHRDLLVGGPSCHKLSSGARGQNGGRITCMAMVRRESKVRTAPANK